MKNSLRLAAVSFVFLFGAVPPGHASAAAGFGNVSTFAGTGTSGPGAPGVAIESALAYPQGTAVDTAANVYIADTYNDRIQKVDTSGNVSTVAGTGIRGPGGPGVATSSNLDSPYGVALDSAGNLYIADSLNHRIQKVDTDGNVSTVAGTGTPGQGGPGTATGSALKTPFDVAVDAAGNLYIADTYNDRIQKVDNSGNVSTIAGTGVAGQGDPGVATSSALERPRGVTLDVAGNIYFADTDNHRIQKVNTDGDISTIAGTGTTGKGDPGIATQSALAYPYSAVLDTAGNVYIADTANHRVQKVDTDGNISTIAGTGTTGTGGPGLATQSALNFPRGVTLDAEGNLLVADTSNDRIQLVDADNVAPSIQVTTNGPVRVDETITIAFSCTDAGGSGLEACTATLDGEAVTNGDVATVTFRGTQTLIVTASDNADNSATDATTVLVNGKRELTGEYAQLSGAPGAIARLYMATFTRNPESTGFSYWTTARSNGAPLQTVADYFATSAEFMTLFGQPSNADFVVLMYQNVMDRSADPEGRTFWLNQLETGMTQARMLLMFSESPEFKQVTYTS